MIDPCLAVVKTDKGVVVIAEGTYRDVANRCEEIASSYNGIEFTVYRVVSVTRDGRKFYLPPSK